MPHTLYTSLLYALSPLIAVWLLKSARQRGGQRLFRERLGRYADTLDTAGAVRPLWLHCASVGEVRTAAPLIRAVIDRRPDLPIIVTTATATGAETAARKLPAEVRHVYQPIDFPSAVRRFLAAYRPCAAVVMETEIWPNLFAEVKRADLPLIVANARLSTRSLNAPTVVRHLQKRALKRVDVVLARSGEDARRFGALGVEPARIQTLGSLKLAPSGESAAAPIDLGRPAILAASTHDDEEIRIAAAWKRAQREPRVPRLLVIAPRHPERGPGIRDALQRAGFMVALRSKQEAWDTADIYVADTLGELEVLMASAELVIIGGSLIARGGQNLVEPARLGRAILFGPDMSNFAEESERLRAAGGAQRFLDEGDLQFALVELFRDPDARRLIGERAAATVAAANDVAALYADAVLEHVPQGV